MDTPRRLPSANHLPHTTKTSSASSCSFASHAVCGMQGWRSAMEDSHKALPPPFSPEIFAPLALYAVYDGHGGAAVSRRLSSLLPSLLAPKLTAAARTEHADAAREAAGAAARAKSRIMTKSRVAAARASVTEGRMTGHFVTSALRETFIEADQRVNETMPHEACSMGSTACVVLVLAADRPELVPAIIAQDSNPKSSGSRSRKLKASQPGSEDERSEGRSPSPLGRDKDDSDDSRGDEGEETAVKGGRDEEKTSLIADKNEGDGAVWGLLWAASSGDTRAVLSRGGKADALTVDHRPETPGERDRIEGMGFEVTNGRVNGNVQVCRGIGDWKYKKKDVTPEKCAISAVPDIRRRTLKAGDEFLIIGCDGVWDCMTRQQAVNYVRLRLFPKDHWSKEELSVDQGINQHPFDPEEPEVVAEIEREVETMGVDPDEFIEKKEVRDRYKLWPGDPGVCSSVEQLLDTISRDICHNCLSKNPGLYPAGTDNVTVMIVLFRGTPFGKQICERYGEVPKKSKTPKTPTVSPEPSATDLVVGQAASGFHGRLLISDTPT